VRHHLTRLGAWDDEREAACIADVDARFKQAVAVAEQTPPPPLESMFEDVYESPPWHLVEQREQLIQGPRAPKSH
jgi:TPP-dependent pyruvate/acetoin dehydrogenase alpha subunit